MDVTTDVDVLDRPPAGPMTEAEFLAWVVQDETRRFEFDGRYPIPMVGSSPRHSQIAFNVAAALHKRLRGTPFAGLMGDTFIRAGGGLRVPDVYVMPRDMPDANVLTDPVVAIEIVSPGSGRTDRVVKAREYFGISSLRHYVILEQDCAAAEILTRGAEGWVRTAAGAGEAIALPALAIEVPVDEIYEGLRFGPPPATVPT